MKKKEKSHDPLDKESLSKKIFVTTVSQDCIQKMMQDLKDQGFEIKFPPHTHFAAKKKGVSCTLYTSLKLTVQGKEMAPFIEFYLEPHILKSLAFTNPGFGEELDLSPRIGVDESGKGDFFGPLCIAGVFAEGEEIQKLKKLGVKDSKTLSDEKIRVLAPKIQSLVKHHIVRIGPTKYNELHKKFGNLNKLLAWGHATVIEKLSTLSQCKKIVVDKFAHEYVVEKAVAQKKIDVTIEQKVRAEEDLVVAAASILARYAFIEGLRNIEEKIGITLPLGASEATIRAGKKVLEKGGEELLFQISKYHFRTKDRIRE